MTCKSRPTSGKGRMPNVYKELLTYLSRQRTAMSWSARALAGALKGREVNEPELPMQSEHDGQLVYSLTSTITQSPSRPMEEIKSPL
jgi:hypothetical protein